MQDGEDSDSRNGIDFGPPFWERPLAALSGAAFFFAVLQVFMDRDFPPPVLIALMLIAIGWLFFESVGRMFVDLAPIRTRFNIFRGVLLVVSCVSLYMSLTRPWQTVNREAYRSAARIVASLCEGAPLPEEPTRVEHLSDEEIRREWSAISEGFRAQACTQDEPRLSLPDAPDPRFTEGNENRDNWYCSLYVSALYICQERLVSGGEASWVLTQFEHIEPHRL